jgi:hypothetical protein
MKNHECSDLLDRFTSSKTKSGVKLYTRGGLFQGFGTRAMKALG